MLTLVKHLGPLSSTDLSDFARDGYLVKPALLSSDTTLTVLAGIDRMICAKYPRYSPLPRQKLIEGLQGRLVDLQRTDRAGLGKLYDAIRKLASFWELVGDPTLTRCAQQLVQTDALGVVFRGAGIRLDLPDEDKWRSQWHQEYHSQMSSLNALVAWVCFSPVTFEMGPVQLAKGSHREGLLAVHANDPLNTKRDYTQTFTIPNVDALTQKYEIVQFETQPGDVVFIDFCTLHQSGFNRSKGGTRISGQIRYFDLMDPDAAERGWTGGWQEGGDFTKEHPDKVIA